MSTAMTLDKTADLAGPGIGNYDELVNVLPDDYDSLLDPKDTQLAITMVSAGVITQNILLREVRSNLIKRDI